MSIGGTKKAKPTKHEVAQRQISLEQAKDFRTRIRPLEDELIKRSTSTEGDKTLARGLASTDAATVTAGADQSAVSRFGTVGSKAAMARAGLAQAVGTGIGRGQGDAEAALKAKDEAAKGNIVSQARGQQGVEMEALSSAVQRGANNSIQSLGRAMQRNEYLGTTVAQGMGAGMERGKQLDEIAAYNKSPEGIAKPYVTRGSRGLDMVTAGFMPGKYDSFYEMQRMNALMSGKV